MSGETFDKTITLIWMVTNGNKLSKLVLHIGDVHELEHGFASGDLSIVCA